MNARYDLLADVASLAEIDAGQAVEVGIVREGLAVAEIAPPVRHAE